MNLNNGKFTRPGDHTLCLKLEGTQSHKLTPTQNTWNMLLISGMPYQHIQRTILITQAKQVDPWRILLDVRGADNRNRHSYYYTRKYHPAIKLGTIGTKIVSSIERLTTKHTQPCQHYTTYQHPLDRTDNFTDKVTSSMAQLSYINTNSEALIEEA